MCTQQVFYMNIIASFSKSHIRKHTMSICPSQIIIILILWSNDCWIISQYPYHFCFFPCKMQDTRHGPATQILHFSSKSHTRWSCRDGWFLPDHISTMMVALFLQYLSIPKLRTARSSTLSFYTMVMYSYPPDSKPLYTLYSSGSLVISSYTI